MLFQLSYQANWRLVDLLDDYGYLTIILRGRAGYIEDITCPRVDMNFIFEWSTRYLTSERTIADDVSFNLCAPARGGFVKLTI